MEHSWKPDLWGTHHKQLCVWKGAYFYDLSEAERIIRKELGLNNPILVVGHVRSSQERIDLLFFVHECDLVRAQAVIPRHRLGIEWWHPDSIGLEGYPDDVLSSYPPKSHETLAAGASLMPFPYFEISPQITTPIKRYRRRRTFYR